MSAFEIGHFIGFWAIPVLLAVAMIIFIIDKSKK